MVEIALESDIGLSGGCVGFKVLCPHGPMTCLHRPSADAAGIDRKVKFLPVVFIKSSAPVDPVLTALGL